MGQSILVEKKKHTLTSFLSPLLSEKQSLKHHLYIVQLTVLTLHISDLITVWRNYMRKLWPALIIDALQCEWICRKYCAHVLYMHACLRAYKTIVHSQLLYSYTCRARSSFFKRGDQTGTQTVAHLESELKDVTLTFYIELYIRIE